MLRNIMHLGAAQIATTVLGILGTVATSRYLGPSDFGVLYIVVAFSGFMGTVVDWGQTYYVVREVARGRSDQPELLGTALSMRAFALVCATVIAAIIAVILGYDSRIVFLIVLGMLVGLPSTLYLAFGFVFRGTDRMDLDAVATVVGKALTLAGIFAALLLGGGVAEVIAANAIGGIGMVAVAIFFTARLGITIRPPNSAIVSELTRAGLPIFLFSVVINFQPFVEVMVLSALAQPVVVGWYGASRTIFGIVLSPALILAQASLPQLSRASLSLPEFEKMMSSMAKLLLLAAAFASSSLYVFSDHIVGIMFGYDRFQQTAVILKVSALFLPLLFLGFLMGTALTVVGRNMVIAYVTGTAILVGAILNWISIPFFQAHYGNGAIALVITAGVAEIGVLIAFAAFLPRGSVGWTIPITLLRSCGASILIAILFSTVSHIELWILAPLFAVAFPLVALVTGLMSTKDVEMALTWLRNYAGTATTTFARLKLRRSRS
ncbi:oligosaccharide flippase family protein [Hyphomicrobium facile]|uniref:oligosaccharide flippase family protein n=1 Tax=Hyphomicrobium facile TaxID=51670 RepID=UPI0011602B57|nr:oligosaccharide flippase family protein [Hyphomicrobium facile]